MAGFDSRQTLRELDVRGRRYDYYSLPAAEVLGLKGISQLPYTLKVVLESVLRHRDPQSHRLIIINDCSPEPGMAGMLRSFAQEPGVALLTNETNLGFPKTANRFSTSAGLRPYATLFA